MHQVAHVEHHFTSSDLVRDIVIGMSDGLTVPFALAAGLSGTNVSTAVIVTAGLAEVAAGSIAMGLGGYLAARSDAEHYESERRREELEVINLPDRERDEVADVFREYGLGDAEIEPILLAFKNNHPAWVDFMMRFELGMEEPDPRRAWRSAMHDRGGVHRRRPDSAGAVQARGQRAAEPGSLNYRDPGGTLDVRLRQGPLHRNASHSKRLAHDLDRWARRRGRLPDRVCVLLSRASQGTTAARRRSPAQFPRSEPIKPGGLVPGTTTRSPGNTW